MSYERLDIDLSTCYHGDGLGVAVGIAEYAPDINFTACRVQNRNLGKNGNRSSNQNNCYALVIRQKFFSKLLKSHLDDGRAHAH